MQKMQNRCFGLLLMVFLLSSIVLKAQSNRDIAFKDGERLHYTGYYNWGMIWVKAGKVDLLTSKTKLGSREVYNIKATGYSMPGWDWFFRLRDTFEVHCDTLNLLPLKFSRIVNEGKYHAHYKYDFDYDKALVFARVKRRDNPEYKTVKPLYSETLDMLSFAWHARNLDYSAYSVGEKIKVRLIISNRIYNLYIRYKGVEEVETRDGIKVECHKFSPMLVKGSMFKGGEEMTVWVSNDRNRVPIMAEAKVIIGNVRGVLSSYKGLRHKSVIFPGSEGLMEDR